MYDKVSFQMDSIHFQPWIVDSTPTRSSCKSISAFTQCSLRYQKDAMETATFQNKTNKNQTSTGALKIYMP